MDRRTRITLQSYDRTAEQYARSNQIVADFWHKEYQDFCRRLPGRRVLEIGSGGGRDATFFIRDRYEYLGIDGSRGLIGVAKKNNPRGQFRLMDMYDLRFPRGSFDGIWTMATLLHVPRKRLPKLLKIIHHLLVPGGVLAVSVKPYRTITESMIQQEKYGGTERFFSFFRLREFRRYLEGAGFIVRSVRWRAQERPKDWISFIATS